MTYYYFEYFGLDPVNVPEMPYDYFFGRWVIYLINFYSEVLVKGGIFFFRFVIVGDIMSQNTP